MNRTRRAGLLLLGCALAGCAHHPSSSAPSPDGGPSEAARYAALPDTSVCVVDRTATRGLRALDAKRDAEGQPVLLVSGHIEPLAKVHPVSVVAGYAGNEPWLADGSPITVQGRRYVKVGGERLVPLDQLQQSGDVHAVPVFSSPSEARPPKAVYLPVRPGCVFQAYVRADLLSGR